MWLELCAIATLALHIYICPYTKVEESFNMQAVHDIINYGFDTNKYDHLVFPGVVPRSFLGPLVVAVISKPFVCLFQSSTATKFTQQFIVRTVTGVLTALSFIMFSSAVKLRFSVSVKKWLILITMTQFHFLFYASRMLPNVMALTLVLLALTAWLRQRHKSFIWLSGASIIIFRFDLVMFLGLILLSEVVNKRMKLSSTIRTTLIAGIMLLALTVGVDSFFWQRTLWPEGEVMWYNVVLNKSSNWGTSPFLWYFYSALPRALSFTCLLIPLAVYQSRPIRALIWPAIGYVFLFSFLPHKELRFIIYTFPVFNVASAFALASLWQGKSRYIIRKLAALAATCLLLLNLAMTVLLLFISKNNYPGGVAIHQLHQLEQDNDVHVHIDVFTAQTGVTRFTQVRDDWIYNKTENLSPGGPDMLTFTHLLIGASDPQDKNLQIYSSTHKTMSAIRAFDRFILDLKSFPPFKIQFRNKCFVLKKMLL